jgi:hypothetical protein
MPFNEMQVYYPETETRQNEFQQSLKLQPESKKQF